MMKLLRTWHFEADIEAQPASASRHCVVVVKFVMHNARVAVNPEPNPNPDCYRNNGCIYKDQIRFRYRDTDIEVPS